MLFALRFCTSLDLYGICFLEMSSPILRRRKVGFECCVCTRFGLGWGVFCIFLLQGYRCFEMVVLYLYIEILATSIIDRIKL